MKLVSFGYKHGKPKGIKVVFDCREIANPHNDPKLRPLTGKDVAVRLAVSSDPATAEIMKAAVAAVKQGNEELAFGCYGGRHRSVAVAELVADQLRGRNLDVEVVHRDL